MQTKDAVTGQINSRDLRELLSTPSWHAPSAQREDGRNRTEHQAGTSNLWERLCASSFPYRYRLLYGLLLESRSFYHRIRLLRQRGDILQPQMGHVWEKAETGHLILHRRTQVRTQDMQELLSCHPWLFPEGWNLFLTGWDAGAEFGASLGREQRSALP